MVAKEKIEEIQSKKIIPKVLIVFKPITLASIFCLGEGQWFSCADSFIPE
jgi:hypothetical protein